MCAARILLGLATLALTCGCATGPEHPAGPPRLTAADYPGRIRPPSTWPPDVLLQQRVSAAWGDTEERGFDAAVQKLGDTLVVLGLSPLGTTGFVIRLDGDELSFENRIEELLPFPPRFILLDVQRVFFPWLVDGGAPAGAGPWRADGTEEELVGEEHVVEVVRDGRLVERRFTRADGEPAGVITVSYEWDDGAAVAPTRAILHNDWFGYRLTIDTFAQTPLSAPAAAAPAPEGGA